MSRIKDLGLEEQQLALDPTLKMKSVEHISASCNREECLKAISIFYQKIEYFDRITEMLAGGWRAN